MYLTVEYLSVTSNFIHETLPAFLQALRNNFYQISNALRRTISVIPLLYSTYYKLVLVIVNIKAHHVNCAIAIQSNEA